MALSYQDLINEAKKEIPEVEPSQLADLIGKVTLLDIRESDEYDQGAIATAQLLPRGLLEGVIGAHVDDSNEEIVIYCAVGARSALAAQTLKRMGYPNVSSLQGGFGRWKSAVSYTHLT